MEVSGDDRLAPLCQVGVVESLLCRLPGDAQAGPDGCPRLAGLAGPDDCGGGFGFGGV
jgi:hypothetical protein